jgi:hypothetical protein
VSDAYSGLMLAARITFLGFVGDELAEIGGRAHERRAAELP